MLSCNWRELLQHLGYTGASFIHVYASYMTFVVGKKGDGEAEEIFSRDY